MKTVLFCGGLGGGALFRHYRRSRAREPHIVHGYQVLLDNINASYEMGACYMPSAEGGLWYVMKGSVCHGHCR